MIRAIIPSIIILESCEKIFFLYLKIILWLYGQLMLIKKTPEFKLLMLTDIFPRKKSSCVARERRTQINQTLCELGALLCPDQDRLDKLTVVRLAAATIKLHAFLKGLLFSSHLISPDSSLNFHLVQNFPATFFFVLY